MASYGSVYQEGKNPHKYRIQFYYGKNPNGKPKKYSKMITANGNTEKQRKKDAERQLAEYRDEILSGNYIKPEKLLLKDFINDWREQYAVHKLAHSTLELYDLQLKTRIIPTLGHYHLEEITPFIIQSFLNDLKKDGARRDGKNEALKGSSINFVRRVVKNVFSRAVEWKFIKENPVIIKKEKESSSAGNVYSKDELSELLKYLPKLELGWRLFFQIAVTCGLRKGELMGLQWEDIDLDTGIIHVRHSLSYSNNTVNGFILKKPKSEKSIRYISLPSDIIPLLRKFHEQRNREKNMLSDLWEGGEYFFVFSNEFGKPYSKRYPLTKWNRFTKRFGLRKIRLHDLRHTNATFLLLNKVDLKTVSSRLGHSRASFTADVYAHKTKETDKQASELFATL
ncbi:tyrosine-type recombinase/integrase [Metabacillus schmidteae]|uniref:tyrosine-type recombinase/integrase n=1 Tax=Metabacillus schmidteae TaxID=2730405 RepID=UPI00158841D2|nr:site-specific integrase [Metabacillus schmidteae]